ncbi:MAG: diguanylate cyclase, partial [Burkholderiales bacterium]
MLTRLLALARQLGIRVWSPLSLASLVVLPAVAAVLALGLTFVWLARESGSSIVPQVIVLTMFALAVAVFAGYWVYRKIARSITRITLVAERFTERPVSADEFPLRLPADRSDEIGQLARTFDLAASEVRMVLDDANAQNELLYEAKGVLETRLIEWAREIGGLRSELSREAAARRDAEERAHKFAALVEYSGDAILVADGHGRIEFSNAAFERLTGYIAAETVGERVDMLHLDSGGRKVLHDALETIRAGGVYRGVLAAEGKGGRTFFADTTISPVGGAGNGSQGFVAILRDATDRVRREAEIHYLAKYDALTRLPNRVSLLEHLQAVTRANRRERDRGSKVAVAYIDLDRFKPVNDRFGHHVGDRVLADVASRLRARLRTEDMVARVGGDEFVAVLTDVVSVESAVRVATKLIEAVGEPIEMSGSSAWVGASIGLTIFPDDGVDAFQLIKQADAAMYHAKAAGGGSVSI